MCGCMSRFLCLRGHHYDGSAPYVPPLTVSWFNSRQEDAITQKNAKSRMSYVLVFAVL